MPIALPYNRYTGAVSKQSSPCGGSNNCYSTTTSGKPGIEHYHPPLYPPTEQPQESLVTIYLSDIISFLQTQVFILELWEWLIVIGAIIIGILVVMV